MLLDHVIVAVPDLDEAVDSYAVICGRPPALRSRSARGTQNALFLFPRGPYLELLAPWDGAPEQGASAAALRRRLAERGPGLSGIALAPSDIDAAVERLRSAGHDVMTPVANSARNDDGRERRWRATRLPSIAGDDSYLVRHMGWDWREALLPPPLPGREHSAATAIHHVAFDVTDAQSASEHWGAWLGVPPAETITSETLGAIIVVHRLDNASVEFVGATRASGPVAERIARRGGLSSLAFEVADATTSAVALRAAGLTVSDPAPGVLPHSRVARIDPAGACEVAAQLVQFLGAGG